jgi:hypothetical protein
MIALASMNVDALLKLRGEISAVLSQKAGELKSHSQDSASRTRLGMVEEGERPAAKSLRNIGAQAARHGQAVGLNRGG